MDTWNLFSLQDLAFGLIGFSGLVSVVVVLRSAFGATNKRERSLKGKN
jgi:hypothetical protein